MKEPGEPKAGDAGQKLTEAGGSIENRERPNPPRLFSDQQLLLLREHDLFEYSQKFLYALSIVSRTPGQTFSLPYNPCLPSNIDVQSWGNVSEKELEEQRRSLDDDMGFFSRGDGMEMEKYLQLYKENHQQAMAGDLIDAKSPLGHRGSSMFRTMDTVPFGGYKKTFGVGESLLLSSLNQANNLRNGVRYYSSFVMNSKIMPADIINLQEGIFEQFLLYSEQFLAVAPRALTAMVRDAEWNPTEIDGTIPRETQDFIRENLQRISTISAKSDNEFSIFEEGVKKIVGDNEARLELIRSWGEKLKEVLDSVVPVMEAARQYLEANVTYADVA